MNYTNKAAFRLTNKIDPVEIVENTGPAQLRLTNKHKCTTHKTRHII